MKTLTLSTTQRTLFDAYLAAWRSPLPCFVARYRGLYTKAKAAGYDDDDIEQEGLIAVAEAARSPHYRDGKGDGPERFAAFANIIVRNRVHRMVQNANRKKRTPEGRIVRGHESDLYKFVCVDPRSARNSDAEDAAEIVGMALATLDERNRLVLCLRYGIGCDVVPYRECGARLGVSTQRAAQIAERSIELCRAVLAVSY